MYGRLMVMGEGNDEEKGRACEKGKDWRLKVQTGKVEDFFFIFFR